MFQSTRPRGARLAVVCRVGVHRYVSIHAPTWGATTLRSVYTSTAICFNPRAHVGRDSSPPRTSQVLLLFQSTRPRGARHPMPCPRCRSSCFNPRAHVGRDVAGLMGNRSVPKVSIHAPTWGATMMKAIATIINGFQSTRPRGARRAPSGSLRKDPLFQSTRPRGARRYPSDKTAPGSEVSIHAPTWGATLGNVGAQNNKSVSIHAPTWGATNYFSINNIHNYSFNPRAHVGRDKDVGGRLRAHQRFQSTRPRGARPTRAM